MGLTIRKDVTLAEYTTLGIGGNARCFAEPATTDELLEALQYAKDEKLAVFILGGGSNLLIDSAGFDGLVIRPCMADAVWTTQANGCVHVSIGAGANFDDVVAMSCDKNLGGIEALSGIPGTAGGAAVQNIGAYGQEIADCFVSAQAIDCDSLEIVSLCRQDMAFGYRQTALKHASNRLVIVSITLELNPFDAQKASEACIAHGFKKLAATPPASARDLRERILETRRAKGMCYDKDVVDSHGVGSFFVNPVVSQGEATRINSAYMQRFRKSVPTYQVADGIKLSAAWLIEEAGFSKGYIHKGAGISGLHSLAIINRQGATSTDVIELAQLIAKTVFRTFNIALEAEVIYLSRQGIAPLPLDLTRTA
ncbi:MAG: UDP-N-acetylmuramate dehydrogenase [Proteobacteria bacterium]|nr:UDP-N-acetylmuramate dehydrogenase [Pseudomonadota bacterium]